MNYIFIINMLTVKKGCAEVDKWNKNATNLVKDLEDTIANFSKLLNFDKENLEPKMRAAPVRAFQILTEQRISSSKADSTTIQRLIKTGIYNLRKSSTPTLSTTPIHGSSLTSSLNTSMRSSSIDSMLKQSRKLTKRFSNSKKKPSRGRSHDRCIRMYLSDITHNS